MEKPAIPKNEAGRLHALNEYSILDTLPEKDFDDITKLASQICGTPISTITLIDNNRQWFKSKQGLDSTGSSRDYAFCAHAINQPDEIMIVPDSRADKRFSDNPLVTGDPHVIFYAGVPLVNPEGYSLGTICIIDNKPGKLTEDQQSALKTIASLVVKMLELRKKNIELDERRLVMERALELFAQMSKVAKVGGWEVDFLKNRVNWTFLTKEIHEVPDDFIPDLQTGLHFYKEGKSRDTIIDLINRAIQTGEPFDVELEIVTAKGNERWIRSKGAAEFTDGKCVRLYGIFQDIHTEKIKDIQLAQSEEMFRQIFDNAFTGMALVNPEGKAIRVNMSLCNMLGYSEQELLQIELRDNTHPDDLSDNLAILKEFNEGKKQKHQFEKRFVHKKRHIIWTILSISLTRDLSGNSIQIVQVTDITAIKQADQLVREERKLLVTLIDNIPINIFIKDVHSRKILVNQKEIEYMGVQSEMDIIGKDDFELYEVDSAAISIAEDMEVFNTGKAIIDKETFNTRHDNTKHWFLTSKIPLKNAENEITGLLGISYDITERKKTEQKLKDLVDITSEQNTRLLNFAHIVSHNLRSHSSNFSMLLGFLETETDESSKKEMFELLKKASANLTETVAHLNEVVAVNTNISKETQLINLNEAIQKVQNNIKGLLIKEQVQCINKVDETIYINAVPAYLDSILLNFFTNSIKYKSADKDAFVELEAAKEGKYIVLSIRDNGVGIDLNRNAHKLFGMYKTFHGNKDARGVGLFITKNQIEAMGGKVEAESKPGAGTTFKIYFV